MRFSILVTLGLCCAACSGGNNSKFDPTDTVGTGGGSDHSSSAASSSGTGTTTGVSTTTTTSTGGSTGTTSTSITGFGSWAGPSSMAVGSAVLASATSTSFTALMFSTALTPTQLCDGNTLNDAAQTSSQAVAIVFSSPGALDTGRQYPIGSGESTQIMELQPFTSGSSTFGPYGTTNAAIGGNLSFFSYDGKTLSAQFSGTMPSLPDGGGVVAFSGAIQAAVCQ